MYEIQWRQASITSKTTQQQHERSLITPTDTERFRQWGNPGRHLNDQRNVPFSQRNKELGFAGEILTSQLIDELTKIPGLRAVHGILVPGFNDADIDHVLLCGNLVIPVDSKNWTGGDYYWLSGQVMCTTLHGLQRRGDPMNWAMNSLSNIFQNKHVMPVIVIHSHDGFPVRTNNQNRGASAELMNPMEFVERVGRLCIDQKATAVDRDTLTTLAQMMA